MTCEEKYRLLAAYQATTQLFAHAVDQFAAITLDSFSRRVCGSEEPMMRAISANMRAVNSTATYPSTAARFLR
jgi:hypothetical protein